MTTIERYPNVSGNQKKDIVVNSIRNIISQTGGDHTLLDIIPSFIDTSISIDNGDIKISPVSEKCCISLFSNIKK
jgi:hypothetical protein